MELSKFNMHAPNIVCVCVDWTSAQDYGGRIWHQYSAEPIGYETAVGLVQRLDELYDRWDFPQRSTNVRTFEDAGSGHRTLPAEREREREKMDERRLTNKAGDIGTFLVRVKYRQNATWQGEVIWVEKNNRQYFRSALELLKLIDGALYETEEDYGRNFAEENEKTALKAAR